MSEVLVQFVGIDGKIRQALSLYPKGRGISELAISDGYGRILNLKHLNPELSLILTGKDGLMIGDELLIQPGETKRFSLDEFDLRISHDPTEITSLRIA